MIEINNSKDCCGCQACMESCPKNCIEMLSDDEGFLYPEVNADKCINCDLCVKVCPMFVSLEPYISENVYAVTNNDQDLVEKSSSAGVYSLLAARVLKEKGVVFGARMSKDFTMVEHDYTETIEGLEAFRGSKYVQSNVNGMFSKVKSFLNEGRKVLFSGTPCQISGLNMYLKKKYSNLLTCDFICHGVPSPMVWKDYISTFTEVKNVEFRNKDFGWRNFSLKISSKTKSITQTINNNIYLKAFNTNVMLRPCCYECRFRLGKSHSDITLGDFWGIENLKLKLNDNDRGVSVVTINSNTLLDEFNQLDINKYKVDYGYVILYNKSIATPTPLPNLRRTFFKQYKDVGCLATLKKYTKDKTVIRVYRYLKSKL